mmetsp:Transcript_6787/g.19653  ORF Transcript_6787/g.19653 Transcript_6787/m.19653 type:complete len:184 (-) Transcript_6787:70-621(-)
MPQLRKRTARDGENAEESERLLGGDAGANAGGSSSETPRMSEEERKRNELAKVWATRVQALFWGGLMFFVVQRTNFLEVLLNGEEVNRIYLNVGIVCVVMNVCIFIFKMYIEPMQSGRRPLLDPMSPHIMVSSVLSILGFFALLKGLWPAYGLLTPVILVVIFMGVLMGSALVPFVFTFYAED